MLGISVMQLIKANIKSASDMSAIQCIKACRHGQTEHQNEKKGDLSDFKVYYTIIYGEKISSEVQFSRREYLIVARGQRKMVNMLIRMQQ